jgi:phage terminase large subunit-like protein
MGPAVELTPALAWRFDCPDWEDRLREGRSLLPDDLPLDWAEAERAVAIFNKLRLPDVEGQPLLADAAGEWQRDIVRAIFGSLDAETKARAIREIFALVPKKNAKTTGGAAIMVTALLMNKRPRAEFVLVGPTQEVADTAFQQASGMIEADAFLTTRYLVQEHIKTIRDRVTGAKLKIKTFDMKVATGSKPAGILLDELHLMSSMADASRVIGQLRGGMIANPEAFLIIITTQSDKPPAGAFKAELDYARGVRDGRITENVAMLPMLYEFSEAAQRSEAWKNSALWSAVLPNAGLSITIERLIAEFKTAESKGIEELQRWASQHLNIEIGLGLHSARWRGADFWEKRADRTLTLDELLRRCEVVVAGIDGGGLDDLFGLCIAGRERETKRWLYWCRAWAWPTVFEQRKSEAATLQDFVDDGDLIRCGHNGGPPIEEWDEPPAASDDDAEPEAPAAIVEEDVAEIVAILAQVKDSGLLPEKNAIGLDPQGVGALVDALAEIELVHPQVVAVTQGFRLSSAVWSLERKLKFGMAAHDGSRLMAWCVGNAKAEQRGNAVLITKETAGKAKIDPLIAALNATKLLEANPEASGVSAYSAERGLLRV